MGYLARKLITGVGWLVVLPVLVGSIAPGFTSFRLDEPTSEQRRSEPEIGTSEGGEFTSMLMDTIIEEVRKTNSIIIIISRLGTGDTRRELHRRRLHNAVARLVDYQRAIPGKQAVTAMGERVDGKGKIEFYVSGRLVYSVLFKPNADFTVDCCGEDPKYYPWYKRPKKIGKA